MAFKYLRGKNAGSLTACTQWEGAYHSTGHLAPKISPIRTYYLTIDDLAAGIKGYEQQLGNGGREIWTSMKSKTKNASGGTIVCPYTTVWSGGKDTLLDKVFDNILTSGLNYKFCYNHEIDAKPARQAGADVDAMKAWAHVWDRYNNRRIAHALPVGTLDFFITYASSGIGVFKNGVYWLGPNGDQLGEAGTLYPDQGGTNRPETVQFIGYDPYNFSGTQGGAPFDASKWHEFVDHAQVGLDFGLLKGKPVIFPEWNGIEDPRTGQEGHKAQWLINADAWMSANSGNKVAGKLYGAAYYDQALYPTTQSFKLANAKPATFSKLQDIWADTGTVHDLAPPSNLGSANITNTSGDLTWVEPTTYADGTPLPAGVVQGYWIYEDGSPTHFATPRPVGSTSFHFGSPTPGSSHTIQMTSFDASGNESAKSPVYTISFVGDTTPPTVPVLTQAGVQGVNVDEVDLTWGASTDSGSGVAYYKIYSAPGNVTTGLTFQARTVGTETSFADGGLANPTTKSYYVTAVDGAGNESTRSSIFSASTISTYVKPDPPDIDDVEAPFSNEVDIDFSVPDDNAGTEPISFFRVYRAVGPTSSGQVLIYQSSDLEDTFFQDLTTSGQTQYTYQLTLVDDLGVESDFSIPATITTPAPVTGTPNPSGVLTQAIIDEIVSSTTNVTRRIEIYEADGVTPWMTGDAAKRIVSGSVTVAYGTSNRRSLDLTLDNIDRALDQNPLGGFWYDKIIKAFCGVVMPDFTYEVQVGEFMVDRINRANFPHQVKVTGLDYVKKCTLSKFTQATTFAAGSDLDELVVAIATNAGIVKMVIPDTGITIQADVTFDAGTTRWDALSKLTDAYGYEIFFDATGHLVMRPYRDPVLSPSVWVFQTGPKVGNLVSFEVDTDDTELYNHVLVTGESSDSTVLPVFAEAINTEPTSPTNIHEIGDRLYPYSSPLITSTAQAQDVAYKFLKIHALEQYAITFNSLVFPWLEVGDIITFLAPDAGPGDPDRYLLTDIGIPLTLGAMSAGGKRVTLITDNGSDFVDPITDPIVQTTPPGTRIPVQTWGSGDTTHSAGGWGSDTQQSHSTGVW